MAIHSSADVSCPLVAEYVDEGEVPTDLVYHPGEVVRPQVVGDYLDIGNVDGAVKEFTVLLQDSSIVTVHGHSLKLVDYFHDDKKFTAYGITLAVGKAEVIIALFSMGQVKGIFSGDVQLSGSSA